MSVCYLATAKPLSPRHLREICVLKFVGFCLLVLMMISLAMAKPPSRDATGAPADQKAGMTRTGFASYYGKGLHGKKTATGERFDKNEISAAHPTYPLGTQLRVTNLRNGRSVNVRVNDRGPARQHRAQGVIIDLSERAATELGFRGQGKTRVKTEVLEWGAPVAAKTATADPIR